MPPVSPVQAASDAPIIPGILDLVQRSFAYMEPRINPPSSMSRLTAASIKEQCMSGEVWTIGERPDACIFLTDKEDCLYIGKLAVREDMRGQGYAKKLIELAAGRARCKGLPALELNTRIELVENHQAFQRLGFAKIAEGRHDGFSEPTYIVMRKYLENLRSNQNTPAAQQS
ncbi:GNAT family N-acetyltransferase [Roseibium sp.]|uniref:GNAT family N-acetyltransferase n=1 Tax=Roseibium sp. TaxID=1936156 RepID=UPI003B5164E2